MKRKYDQEPCKDESKKSKLEFKREVCFIGNKTNPKTIYWLENNSIMRTAEFNVESIVKAVRHIDLSVLELIRTSNLSDKQEWLTLSFKAAGKYNCIKP